jgi:hypothetical protein|tara:strand:+ start:110 stop:379 length:270 start_codon:yes stop_codon:yes gene_type:complete
MLREHIQWKDDGTGFLQVRVTPKASANRVRIEERSEGPLVRVDVTVAPEDGKANKQVVKLLARELSLPKSALVIVRGQTSREKTISIQG